VEIEDYFRMLDEHVAKQYDIAGAARKKGLDPSNEVEAQPTRNMAERVEGLVGPKYIADEIKKAQEEKLSREKIVERVIDWILKGTYLKDMSKEQKVEQALRTAMAILTEGVVSAPLEGISQVKIEKNPDGSEYLGIYFAGPIRGAGGTAAALSVLLGDYIRRKVGIADYRPTDTEVERYKEEIHIYHKRIVRLQYMPSDEEIELIVRSVPVCIDGDPTERMEVDLHKGLERVKTDRVRGGICLVIGEGIAQKAKKVLKFADGIGLDGWEWLKDLKKGGGNGKKEDGKPEMRVIRPNKKFLDDIVAGRPIFAYPSRPGAWRLRYGRSNTCGVASKAIHPACMEILEEFPVTGTQMRVERPGKGTIATPCAEIEAPVIKDNDGNVRIITSVKEARKLRSEVAEILYLGDMLVPFGDFLNYNDTLPPSGYVEEWWEQEYVKAGGDEFKIEKIRAGKPPLPVDGKKAVEISKKLGIPLHPKYTLPWHDIKVSDIRELVDWFSSPVDFDYSENKILLKNNKAEAKRTLELLLVPHSVDGDMVAFDDYAIPLLVSLGLLDDDNKISPKKCRDVLASFEDDDNAFNLLEKTSPITIHRKVGCYVGARMGRPEKAKERKMEPAVHALFPVGEKGGSTRSVNAAAKNPFIRIDLARMRCPKCKKLTFLKKCPSCSAETALEYKCSCGYVGPDKTCKKCKKDATGYELTELPIKSIFEKANSNIRLRSNILLKGVKGMTSANKIPEPLEKGISRVNNGVFVFKDGTIRYDGTDIPTTHFRPKDIGTTIEQLKQLGYEKDIEGRPLESKDQILELMVQDIIIPTNSRDYIKGVCNFVDDLLENFYGLESFYGIKKHEDLNGQLVVGLAPHTSAAILGRIIGHADVKGILAHPFWHSAKRRNCDGDEDAIMLLMDVLLNFSYSYLPSSRGGKMDAPLVINTNLDPNEVDSEAHCMETGFSYPLEFYELTQKLPNPKDVDMIDIIENHLEDDPYHMGLTHFSTWVGAPRESRYVQLGEMSEKADIELKLCKRIRCVDVSDVAKRLIDSHLIRDTYGNLRAFARQKFRCVKCNAKYRRPPILGKCDKCGGRVILTVSQGTITKYVDLTDDVVKNYVQSDYIKQRMELVKKEIESVFENDKSKQFSLAQFA
jgi:DNA polymerase II large subunit